MASCGCAVNVQETTASHVELCPCGDFAYVANRVGVPLDGACEASVEGSISVIQLSPELKLLDVSLKRLYYPPHRQLLLDIASSVELYCELRI